MPDLPLAFLATSWLERGFRVVRRSRGHWIFQRFRVSEQYIEGELCRASRGSMPFLAIWPYRRCDRCRGVRTVCSTRWFAHCASRLRQRRPWFMFRGPELGQRFRRSSRDRPVLATACATSSRSARLHRMPMRRRRRRRWISWEPARSGRWSVDSRQVLDEDNLRARGESHRPRCWRRRGASQHCELPGSVRSNEPWLFFRRASRVGSGSAR